jgi:hypothetical protein
MNVDLYNQFDFTRRQLYRMGREGEVILFHGTNWRNINAYHPSPERVDVSIITNGFQIGGSDGHVAVNGTGMVDLINIPSYG